MLGGNMAAQAANVHSFDALLIGGEPAKLSDYQGKTLLIVNTASQCGFTPQYAGLQKLYERYRDRGLAILAFPSNDFGGQEPGSNEEIKKFCDLRFNVTFDLFSKIKVKGEGQHPLYGYLTGTSPFPGEIQWNFTKFVVGPDGEVRARFGSKTDPLAPEMTAAIEAALA
jgi:glutathione peroxidase